MCLSMIEKPIKLLIRSLQKTRTRARGALLWGYEQRLSGMVKTHGKLPQHLGLILDGNRRYAKAIGMQRELGHTLAQIKPMKCCSGA